jgi:integrase
MEGTARKGERWLSARSVMSLARKPGRHADGGGLYLEVDGGRCSWIWRYRLQAKRRDMGLGRYPEIGLAEARAERDRWRVILKTGLDPIEDRERQRTAANASAAGIPTFGEVADAYIERNAPGWKSAIHADQWRMTLAEYAAPIRSTPVDRIATADVLAVLKPLWQAKPETAARLRGRLEMVLDAARALGHIEEGRANPARWRGHLDKLLPKRSVASRGHHAAMPFKNVPTFVAALRKVDTVGARALEFTILTAVRTGEALGATWGEISVEERVWIIPKERMKSGREHRIPLVKRVIELLEEVRPLDGTFVFPGRRPKRPMSNMVFEMLLRRVGVPFTVHGFRSSFRDWAGESTQFPREIAEAALAHVVGDQTERAYRRGDALERRRALMEAWSEFIGPADSNVIHLNVRRHSAPS